MPPPGDNRVEFELGIGENKLPAEVAAARKKLEEFTAGAPAQPRLAFKGHFEQAGKEAEKAGQKFEGFFGKLRLGSVVIRDTAGAITQFVARLGLVGGIVSTVLAPFTLLVTRFAEIGKRAKDAQKNVQELADALGAAQKAAAEGFKRLGPESTDEDFEAQKERFRAERDAEYARNSQRQDNARKEAARQKRIQDADDVYYKHLDELEKKRQRSKIEGNMDADAEQRRQDEDASKQNQKFIDDQHASTLTGIDAINFAEDRALRDAEALKDQLTKEELEKRKQAIRERYAFERAERHKEQEKEDADRRRWVEDRKREIQEQAEAIAKAFQKMVQSERDAASDAMRRSVDTLNEQLVTSVNRIAQIAERIHNQGRKL